MIGTSTSRKRKIGGLIAFVPRRFTSITIIPTALLDTPSLHINIMVRSTILFAASIAATCQAFAPTSSFVGRSNNVATCAPKKSTRNGLKMQVIDITSEDAFDKTLSSASDALVIVDYSTTWCGPCKVIKPVFDQMSENYPDAIFLQVCTYLTVIVS